MDRNASRVLIQYMCFIWLFNVDFPKSDTKKTRFVSALFCRFSIEHSGILTSELSYFLRLQRGFGGWAKMLACVSSHALMCISRRGRAAGKMLARGRQNACRRVALRTYAYLRGVGGWQVACMCVVLGAHVPQKNRQELYILCIK